jgi:hypothetical protein
MRLEHCTYNISHFFQVHWNVKRKVMQAKSFRKSNLFLRLVVPTITSPYDIYRLMSLSTSTSPVHFMRSAKQCRCRRCLHVRHSLTTATKVRLSQCSGAANSIFRWESRYPGYKRIRLCEVGWGFWRPTSVAARGRLNKFWGSRAV